MISRVARDSTEFRNDHSLGRTDARRIKAGELPFGLQDTIANKGFKDDAGSSRPAEAPADGQPVARIVDAVLAQIGLAAEEGATPVGEQHEVLVMGYVAGVAQRLCRASAMSSETEQLTLAVLHNLYEIGKRDAIDAKFQSHLARDVEPLFRSAQAAGRLDGARLEGDDGRALLLVDLLLGQQAGRWRPARA